MYDDRQTSIATFGYRRAPMAQAGDIVHAIDEMLQNSDAQPRRIHWVSDSIAMIDRIGVRIAVALCLPAARIATRISCLPSGAVPRIRPATTYWMSLSHISPTG